MKKSILKLLLITPLIIFSCKGREGKVSEADITKSQDSTMQLQQLFDPASMPEEPIFDIVTSAGTIRIKLYKETPKHRDNFVLLASQGFYNGVLFHRVIKGFMIQTGDPLTKDMKNVESFGTGGPGYTVPAEFLPKVLKHKKGAVAAARRGDYTNPEKESSGSQFYIVEDEDACAQLDGNYTVFGETLEGFEVIDAIASVATNQQDRPIENVVIIEVKPVL